MVFPELCITGYTCHDLFWQETLLESAKEQLLVLAEELKDMPGLIFVGLPLVFHGKLYNTAAALCEGKILGIVPKEYLPNYSEFYEARHFSSGKDVFGMITLGAGRFPLAAGCFLSVMICRGFVWQQRSAKICGHPVRPVQPTPWRAPM